MGGSAVENTKIREIEAEDAAIPPLLMRRARALLQGLPIVVGSGEGFDYISILDVDPELPEDGFASPRWSLTMTLDGRWVVNDAGMWDYLEVFEPPSVALFSRLIEAVAAIKAAVGHRVDG